jgi:hypothetical protein
VNGNCLPREGDVSNRHAKALILGNSSTVEQRTLTALVKLAVQDLSSRELCLTHHPKPAKTPSRCLTFLEAA